MIIGIYKKESNSIISQKNLIDEYINEKKDLILKDVYIDDGFTGTDFNRPEFNRLLEDMKLKKINCIIVKDLSRLGRNYIEVGNYIEQIFPLFNIRFISINDNIDSFKDENSLNSIIVPFKNIINDEYCRDTSIKIRTAINARRKKGEFVGAFAPYGYVRNKENKHILEIDEEASFIVKKIFEWKVYEGMGNIKICQKLNDMGIINPAGYKEKVLKLNYKTFNKSDYLWTPSTVRNILRNDVYIGNMTQGKRKVKSYKIHKIENVDEKEWIRVENTHKPIIEKSLFEKAQFLQKKDTKVQKNGTLSIWAGKLRCSKCKMAMSKKISTNKNKIRYEYYICSTYRKKSKHLCTRSLVKVENLEKIVLELLKFYFSICDFEKVICRLRKSKLKDLRTSKKESLESIIKVKENEIKRFDFLKQTLYEDLKEKILSKEEYFKYKEKYDNNIKENEKNIAKLSDMLNSKKKTHGKSEDFIKEVENMKNIDALDRTIVDELIDYIEVKNSKDIIIYLKFSM